MAEIKGFRADMLKKAMKENEATIEDIAKSLQEEFGCTDMEFAYACAETYTYADNCNIPTLDLYAICKAVNVSADYLLGLSDEM